MSVKNPVIEAKKLFFRYNGHSVLENISLTVEEGSYVGVLGPNGGGKTTLLKLMLGLLSPSDGKITVFGKSPSEARKEGQIGYVPQRIVQTDFPFPANVEEIVKSGRTAKARIGTWRTLSDTEAIKRAMDATEVTQYRSRLISELSGGERQRVFIARALASEPRMLILDEPTTGVDVGSKERFYALLKKLNTDLHLTILFVSHDIEVMTDQVQCVLCINRELICDCASCDFLNKAVLENLYGKNISLIHHHH